METGIYKIVNIEDNKAYIGSAKNFLKRKYMHFHLLSKNKHHSTYFQNAYNKYGKNNFIFEIIEKCNIEILIEREQYFINLYKPEYNMTMVAGKATNLGKKFSENHKLLISKAHKGKTISVLAKEKMSKSKEKAVLQFDKKDNFIKEWESAKKAKKLYKYANITEVCKGNRKTACGFIWRYKN